VYNFGDIRSRNPKLKFMLLTITPFAAIQHKSACHAKYSISECPGPIIDILYRFGRHIGGDDYPDICLAVAQVTLLWQPVMRCSQTLLGGPLLFASAFDNGLADRIFAFKRLYGNIRATLRTNLVGIYPIISELRC